MIGTASSVPDRLSSLSTAKSRTSRPNTPQTPVPALPTSALYKFSSSGGEDNDSKRSSSPHPTKNTIDAGSSSTPATTPPASEVSHNRTAAKLRGKDTSSISSLSPRLLHSFPLTPPPNSPLPAVPSSAQSSTQSTFPSKPKLQPKRGHSRSPSPITTDSSLPSPRQQQQLEEELKSAVVSERIKQRPRRELEPVIRSQLPLDTKLANSMFNRPNTDGDHHQRPTLQGPHRQRSNQNYQMGYAIGSQQDEGHTTTKTTVNQQSQPSGPTYSKFGSPFDDTRQTETAFGSYIDAPTKSTAGARIVSTSASTPNFSPGNGPLLLNSSGGDAGQRRKGTSSNLPYVSNAASFNRSPPSSSHGPDRSFGMTQQLEGITNKAQSNAPNHARQVRVQSPPMHQRYRGLEQEAMTSADDVVMADGVVDQNDETSSYPNEDVGEGGDYDDDFDENEFVLFPGPPLRSQSVPDSRAVQSFRQDDASDVGSQNDDYEPAWADDASIIDASEYTAQPQPRYQAQQQQQQVPRRTEQRRTHSGKGRDEMNAQRAKSPEEETFEVAALRRQVEQLQMALKKQMVSMERTKSNSRPPPPSVPSQVSARSGPGVRYPFGIPSPDPSRDSSMISARKTTPSKQAAYRGGPDYYPPDASYIDHYQSPHMPPGYHAMDQQQGSYQDRRQAYHSAHQALHHQQQQLQSDLDDYRRMANPRQRVTSDPPTMSSILADESASAFVRDNESARMEELSRKIDALERMFQTASTISPPQSESGSQNQQGQITPQPPQSYPLQHSQSSQSYLPPRQQHQFQTRNQRTPSLSTVSTRDGGTYGRSRSPAMSAFNYNTTPYARANGMSESDFAGSQGSHPHGHHDNGSSSSVNRRKKGVARFIMGVGASRSNVPRDEHGNPLPTMQVSWSRKRTEKVAKPVSNTKMKVGPGRGRIVMKPPPSAAAAATNSNASNAPQQ